MLYLASQMLNKAKRKYNNIYVNAEREIASILNVYLSKYSSKFSGVEWDRTVQHILQATYEANSKAIKIINEQLEEAYAEGSNVTLYKIEKELGHRTNLLPYTAAVVSALVEAKIVSLNVKNLNKSKDQKWGRTKLYGAVRVATRIDGLQSDNLASFIAKRVISSMKRSMDDIAQVVICGSYDDGVYKTGIEVQNAGINVEKTWLSIMDMNVRDSHKHLNNTTMPINTPFQSFHGPIRFPHDPEAALEEICGCRCRMAVHLQGRAPKYSKNRLLPTETSAYRRWRDNTILELGGEVELVRLHLQFRE